MQQANVHAVRQEIQMSDPRRSMDRLYAWRVFSIYQPQYEVRPIEQPLARSSNGKPPTNFPTPGRHYSFLVFGQYSVHLVP
jgi:hypothetical protein